MQQNRQAQACETSTIHFPEDISLGRVFVMPQGDDPVQQHLWVPEFSAQGAIVVPANHRTVLVFNGSTLAPLQYLPSDAIDELRLLKPHRNVSEVGYSGRLDSDELAYLARLSGLCALVLSRVGIEQHGRHQFQNLTHITDLSLVGGEFDDTIFPMLESLDHLQVLSIDDTAMDHLNLARLQRLPHLHALWGFRPGDELMPIVARFPALRSLDLSEGGVTNKGMIHCQHMPQLETLYLMMSEDVGNSGIRHLRTVSHLRILNLTEVPSVTNAGLAALQELPKLQQLYLLGTRISDRGMAHLKEMPTLEVLELPGTITDAGLRILPSLPTLRVLSLRTNIEITDECLVAVGACPTLQVLDLSETTINDAGLAYLRDISQLMVLDLWNTPVSDEGLAHLHVHTMLRHVIVRGTQVTKTGIAALREALPQCVIVAS
jgi:Leucine-rich repeat (LRR) protein